MASDSIDLGDPTEWDDDILTAVVGGILIQHGAENGDQELIARREMIYAEFERRQNTDAAPFN